MEDQVYDGIDDYLRYVPRWAKLFDTPLTANSIQRVRLRGLEPLARPPLRARRSSATPGRGAIHVKPAGFSVAAYDAAIRAAGRSEFSLDFARFARDVAEWRTGTVFREGAPLPGRPPPGQPAASTARPLLPHLNHTTFQLLRVHARTAAAVVVDADGAARGRRRAGPGRADRKRAARPRRLAPALHAPTAAR